MRKENEVALQQRGMRIVRWMCGIKVEDRVLSKELKERLGLDDIILVLEQNRLHWTIGMGMSGTTCCEKKTGWVQK